MQEKQGFFHHLLFGDLAKAPARVRERMLATIPTTMLSLVLYSVTQFAITATTVYIAREPWAWAWLVLSIAMISWRSIAPVIALRRNRPQPLISIMLSSGITMASFGFGSAMSIASGDIALVTMSLSGTMGVLGGLATRWAALPRPAITTMMLSILPPVVVLAMQGGAHLLAAIALAFVVVSIASFTLHNQHNLLAAVMAEDMLRRKAQTDHLTGLANRAELMQRMTEACEQLPGQTTGRGRAFAVLYIDLDGFKAINDTHGHAAGDEVLQRVAACLQQVVGPDELIARIGGDEFVVLLQDADGLTARGVADEIIDVVSREHRIAGTMPLAVGCSIGISVAPDQGSEAEVLLARADSALYEVKNQGKGHTGMWRALADA